MTLPLTPEGDIPELSDWSDARFNAWLRYEMASLIDRQDNADDVPPPLHPNASCEVCPDCGNPDCEKLTPVEEDAVERAVPDGQDTAYYRAQLIKYIRVSQNTKDALGAALLEAQQDTRTVLGIFDQYKWRAMVITSGTLVLGFVLGLMFRWAFLLAVRIFQLFVIKAG